MIIGLTGKKRAGKDSVAAVLRGEGFSVDSFAAPIRNFVAEMLCWGPDQLDARKEEPLDFLDGITPRHLMQTIGTEWGRQMICPDLWVLLLSRRLSKRSATDVVIPDVRFTNEALTIHDAGGIIVEVRRPSLQNADLHVSEAGIESRLVDVVIVNGGSLEGLKCNVLEWLKIARGND